MNVRYDERHFHAGETAAESAFRRVIAAAGARRAQRLQAEVPGLFRVLRAARTRNAALAPVAERWLALRVAEVDEPLRRATVAVLAMQSEPSVALPACLAALRVETHARLARFLEGPHAYDHGRFGGDLALASDAALSAGALTVDMPPNDANDGANASPNDRQRHGLLSREGLMGRERFRPLKRGAGFWVHAMAQEGPGPALGWLTLFATGRMAELHVDTRNLKDFNEAGFVRCYHRIAALLEARWDIAGVCGGSWLYDPKLAAVSPNLAFVRDTAEAGGAAFLRLRTEPIQAAFAVAHSPDRRRKRDEGVYDPACYAMCWSREALLAWARRTGG